MATTKIFLFIGKKYNNGESPIMLRVINQRKIRYISLGYSCESSDWNKDKCRLRKNYPNYKTINNVLSTLELKAENILSEFKKNDIPFTFQKFEKQFNSNPNNNYSVYDFFDIRINEITKLNTRRVYIDTRNALFNFADKRISFTDINYDFLKKFENHLIKKGLSGGGINFYMRTLRALMNEAINREHLDRSFYPFSNQYNKAGYSLGHLKSITNPRALSEGDMMKIKLFPIEQYPNLRNSIYYFLFSYYARGINFSDMANLKWSDFYDGRLKYIRNKTSGFFNIKISDNMNHILTFFKENYPNDEYVFPILNSFHQTESQIKNRIKKCLKQFNKDLKEIADILDIKIKLTSYVARHTYATTLKRRGESVAVISQGLGHRDISTTTAYLAKFENDIIDKSDELL